MKEPHVSFIIPAKNAEAYLAETLNSCLTQSLKQIEILVIDDGSTDATYELSQWYAAKDKRIRVLSNPGKPGAPAARNHGVREALGRVMCILDSDDLCDKYRAKESYNFFKDRSFEPAYFYGAAALLNFVSQEIRRVIAEPFDLKKALETKMNYIVHSTVAMTRELALQFPFDEGEYGALGLEDWQQQHRMIKAGVPFLHTPKILAAYRVHNEGITKKRDEKKVELLKNTFLEKEAVHGQAA